MSDGTGTYGAVMIHSFSGSKERRIRTGDPRGRGNGWTLLELLLSVAVAAVVVTLLYSLFHTALTAMRAKDGARSRSTEISDVLGQLRDDLVNAVHPEGDEDCEMVLEGGEFGDPPEFHRLELCTKELPEGERDSRWHHIMRVAYRAESSRAGIRLLRSRSAMAGPEVSDPPVTNTVIDSLESIHIEFYDGESWVGAWPPEETNARPVAARMSLRVLERGKTSAYETEIHLPTGTVATGRDDDQDRDP